MLMLSERILGTNWQIADRVFDYMGVGPVQGSYRTTFNGIVSLMWVYYRVSTPRI